jgi:hypothetical protein
MDRRRDRQGSGSKKKDRQTGKQTQEGYMNINIKVLLATTGIAAFAFAPANAFEGGYPGWANLPGGLMGASAGVPPPGIYMINQVFTYQANLAGPGTTTLGIGKHDGVQAASDIQVFLFVPGWTFFGGTYDAAVAFPFALASVGSPVASAPGANNQFSGMHQTIIVNELAWKLGTSGFAVKAGLNVNVPDGNIQGPAGLNNVAAPFYTFQPTIIVSYLKDGWNLSAAIYEEFNTANSIDHYTTGDILHADFTATRTFGKWTIGPIAYFSGQVSNDSCPVGSCTVVGGTSGNPQRYALWGVGGMVGYDFGPASLSLRATREISATASNAAVVAAGGADPSLITQGTTLFATLSYRIWAPGERD